MHRHPQHCPRIATEELCDRIKRDTLNAPPIDRHNGVTHPNSRLKRRGTLVETRCLRVPPRGTDPHAHTGVPPRGLKDQIAPLLLRRVASIRIEARHHAIDSPLHKPFRGNPIDIKLGCHSKHGKKRVEPRAEVLQHRPGRHKRPRACHKQRQQHCPA